MVYIAKDANGNEVNLVEINPEQIDSWQKLTGLVLEVPKVADTDPTEVSE